MGRLRLQLSNIELESMTSWPAPMIEDYLAINYALNLATPDTVVISAEVTTRGFQIILADNAAPMNINLNPRAVDGERVTVKNIGAGNVTIVGNIDGVANDVLPLSNVGNYVFFSSVGYWVKF